MDEKPFQSPRLSINRVYTRGGDGGETSLIGGRRVLKNHARVRVYGTIDELNASIGIAAVTARECAQQNARFERLCLWLSRTQHQLFNLGSSLASDQSQVASGQPRIFEEESRVLEREIDALNEALPALSSFVLPGGSRLEAELHVCRTVCRRAERLCVGLAASETVDPESVRYLNRLSDAFFVWARWCNAEQGVPELLWDPNLGK